MLGGDGGRVQKEAREEASSALTLSRERDRAREREGGRRVEAAGVSSPGVAARVEAHLPAPRGPAPAVLVQVDGGAVPAPRAGGATGATSAINVTSATHAVGALGALNVTGATGAIGATDAARVQLASIASVDSVQPFKL